MGRAALSAVVLLAAALASPLEAADIVFTTENDLLTNNPTDDDLYTFALSLGFTHGPYAITLAQNAFTDREAGARFDESRATAARGVPGLGDWQLEGEVGIVHVGRGLLDQEFQNWFHRQIGSEELDLEYVDASIHPLVGLRAERPFRLAPSFELGPRFEVEAALGFRSHAVIGTQGRWQAARAVAVDGLVGGRFSQASLELLERHLSPLAPIARVRVILADSLALSWTYNEHGDRREHVSLGFWTQFGEGARRKPGR